jgi:dTDP-4-amino-4,6-dideoxygalactose transaminase
MRPYIHLSPPHVGAGERELLLAAFDSNWVAPAGPDLDEFEREVAAAVGVRRAVALCSGTAGLHLALRLVGVAAGDTVLVPSFTFVATANPVSYLGATPVFLDSSADTWTLDPTLLAEELAARSSHGRLPAAVVAVDIYGQCADYDAITALCDEYGIPLIEDAAEALGSTYRGRPAGGFGSIGVVSFNGNKIITTGGGGSLLTNDPELAAEARLLSTQAREPVPHYQHRTMGYNYRLSNPLAAMGRGQLHLLKDRVKARQQTNQRYRECLAEEPGVDFMPLAAYGESNCWLTCILITEGLFGATPGEVRRHLAAGGIESRPTWLPLHLQPLFRDCQVLGGSVAEDLFHRGLCLPSGSRLTESDLDRVVDAVRSVPRRPVRRPG